MVQHWQLSMYSISIGPYAVPPITCYTNNWQLTFFLLLPNNFIVLVVINANRTQTGLNLDQRAFLHVSLCERNLWALLLLYFKSLYLYFSRAVLKQPNHVDRVNVIYNLLVDPVTHVLCLWAYLHIYNYIQIGQSKCSDKTNRLPIMNRNLQLE